MHFPSFNRNIVYKNGFVDFEAGSIEDVNKLCVPLACFNVSPSENGDQHVAGGIVFAGSFEIFELAHGSIPKSYWLASFAVVE